MKQRLSIATPRKKAPVLAFASGLTDRRLNARQEVILKLALAGKTNREISDELGMIPQVVRNNFRWIYRKLGVKSREQLLVKMQTKRPAIAGRPVRLPIGTAVPLATAEKIAILEALLQAQGNTAKAAKLLRISKAALREKIKTHFL